MGAAYSVDSLRVRGAAWRVRGWCAGEAPLVAAELRVASSERFPLTINVPRDDRPTSPDEAARGMHLGFFGFGTGWPSGAPKVELHLGYADGGKDVVDVTRFLNRGQVLLRLKRSLAVAWQHIKRRRYRLLSSKVARRLRRPAREVILQLPPSVPRAPLSLIVDHDLGGGANKFARQLADDLRTAGKSPARLVYSPFALRFELHLPGEIVACDTLELALGRVAALGVREIHLNSSVGYPDNAAVLRQLRELAATAAAPIHFYIHDYYAACPTYNLIDWQERYCGAPATEVCNAQCLRQINNAFVRSQAASDILAWRREWEELFLAAREIRFFSQVSLDIIRRAFPALPSRWCVVAPHRTDEVAPTPLRPRGLTIVVVGDVNMPKGAKRVRELCEHIARTNADARIVIVGTIDEYLDYPFVRMTGPYDSTQLGAIFRREGAAVAFFPSIWPETFSYVVSELMRQQLPIVAFDIGAPAERLAQSTRAALLPLEASTEVAFAALVRLALPSGATGRARGPRR